MSPNISQARPIVLQYLATSSAFFRILLSGADVVAVCGGRRIDVQVTDLDTGRKSPKPGELKNAY
jgi:hypothetical protein